MLSDDQIRLIVGLLLSIPLSTLIRVIPQRKMRYTYSFLMGTILQFYVYGFDIWIPFLQHTIVYLMMKIKGRKCGALVTIYSMTFLYGYHIYRMVTDYGSWVLDISTILMTIVPRYSLIAYDYQDGGQSLQTLNQQHKKSRLKQLPSFGAYLSFCQFLPCAITGTTFQFSHWRDYMNLDTSYDKVKIDWKLVGFSFCQSIFYVLFYLFGAIYFPIAFMKTNQFSHNGFIYIFFYSFVSVTLLRFKYYFGWKLSMCPIHASGFSYNPVQQKFNRVNTCNPQIVQTTIHIKQKIDNWNMSTSLWLRKVIYQRGPFKSKEQNQFFTFFISALWHGTYAGYYLSFGLWCAQLHMSQIIFRLCKNDKFFLKVIYTKLGKLGFVLLWIFWNGLFSHNGLYFQILEGSAGLKILYEISYIPVIFLVVGIIVFSMFKPPKKPKVETKSQ